MRRSCFAYVAILGMLLLPLSGIMPRDAAAQDKVTLEVWDQFTDVASDVADEIYADFSTKYPNITIKRQAVPDQQMRQTVKTALASGTGPDVVYYAPGPSYAGVLADAGLILPLDDFAQQYGWNTKVAGAALQGTMLNGKLYGLPLEIDLIGMYYNKTLIEKEGLAVPETWDQLLTFCQQAKDKGYMPMAFSNNPGWQAFHSFSMTANSMIGPDAMGDLLLNHKGGWDTPEMVTAIRSFFVDLRDAGCFTKDVNALSYDDASALFYTGKALLNPTGSWLANRIEANVTSDEIGFSVFPAPPGAKGAYWDSGIGSAWVISAKSAHQAAAAQFLDYLISPEAAVLWVGKASYFLPVQVDTANLQLAPLFKSILETLGSAAAGEISLGYNIDVLAPAAFNEAMQTGFQAVIAGDKSPEQQAADLQTAWQQGSS